MLFDTWIYQHFINTLLFPLTIVGGLFITLIILIFKKTKEKAAEK